MTNLTHDEMNLLCIYQKNTRIGTMDSITVMQQYLEKDETELAQMSDEEFDELEKFPDFNY